MPYPNYTDEEIAKFSSGERKFWLRWRQIQGDVLPPIWNGVKVGVWQNGFWDFAWNKAKVVVDIQGGVYVRGHHSRGKGMEDDYLKALAAIEEGWTVIVISAGQADNLEIVSRIARIVQYKLLSRLEWEKEDVAYNDLGLMSLIDDTGCMDGEE